MNAKPARSQLDRSQTHISELFSPDYGDPIVNRTVPYIQLGGHKLRICGSESYLINCAPNSDPFCR